MKKHRSREEKNPEHRLAEEGQERQASREEKPVQAPDAPVVNNARVHTHPENLAQRASGDREVNPEYGDVADPTSEELGTHHRDE